jgi:hypothetical protein
MAHLKITFLKEKINRVAQLLASKGSKRHLWAPLRSNIPRSALCAILDTYNLIMSGKK